MSSIIRVLETSSLLLLMALCVSRLALADVLILSPKNPKALAVAAQIKSQIPYQKVVISDDKNAVESPALVITLGSKLLNDHAKDLNAPTLASFVAPSQFSRGNFRGDKPVEPVYSVADPIALLEFLEKNFGSSRVGYVYSGEKDEYVDMLERISQVSEISFVSFKMESDDVFKTLRRVVSSRKIDIMLISNDSRIFNRKNIRFVLEALYRKKIPTIGLSKSLIDAGAVAAVYSEEQSLIAQTIARANNFLQTNSFNGEMYASTLGVVFKKEFVEEFDLDPQGDFVLQ